MSESVPLHGECFGEKAVWRGHDDIGVDDGSPVRFRIELNKAEIYWIDFV
jgi:hypothetical protein